MRMQHYTKQLWCIVFITATGVGLIYVLSTTGVLDAMRDDDTLRALYDDHGKLPKAPLKRMGAGGGGGVGGGQRPAVAMTTAGDVISEAQERRLQQLSVMASLARQDIKQGFRHEGIKETLIPHIIHQTWDSHAIPRTFQKGIRSFLELNPHWEYWFWTPKAVDCFLEKYYPQYAVLFNAYPDPTSKADAMRYFILHKYGGFYVDIDTVCLKPLEMWTLNYCCILSEEPYEHSYIVRQSNVSNIVNSPMGCRPQYPLFEAAIGGLPESAAMYFGDYIQSTGPVFLERIYESFLRNRTSQSECALTLIPPKYFLPRFDPNQSEIIDKRCDFRTYKQLKPKQQRVCERLIKNSYKNDVDPDSYMDHSWIHVNMLGDKWKSGNTVPLKEVVPKAKDMEIRFCSL